ncbi:MAG: hypothetical protein GY820_29335 [Gammaproteobacteria bacterium]|nr:hypothetical protein [Gammaproteobacteria bacterium]
MIKRLISICVLSAMSVVCYAEDKIELQTTIIKGNKELPKILYIVPWKDVKPAKKNQQELVLHSLFGDLFEPVLPVHTLQ